MKIILTWILVYTLSFFLIIVMGQASLKGIIESFSVNIYWFNHIFQIVEAGIMSLIGFGLGKLLRFNGKKLIGISVLISLMIFAPLLYLQGIIFTIT